MAEKKNDKTGKGTAALAAQSPDEPGAAPHEIRQAQQEQHEAAQGEREEGSIPINADQVVMHFDDESWIVLSRDTTGHSHWQFKEYNPDFGPDAVSQGVMTMARAAKFADDAAEVEAYPNAHVDQLDQDQAEQAQEDVKAADEGREPRNLAAERAEAKDGKGSSKEKQPA
ncbi:MAG TPA: hypothetical protein VIS51_04350 [Solirubrobacterales bacterium]